MAKPARSDRKYQAAEKALRLRIVEGQFFPGARLPTQRCLSEEFNLSPVTLQKATRRLAREGFLRVMGSRGTFVAESSPHLCRYGIVFPSRPDGATHWSHFWSTLQLAANSIAAAEPPKQVVSFYEVDGHNDAEDYQRLLADIEARRLAGVIILSMPGMLLHTPLFGDCPVPRVYIGADIWWRWHIPSVAPDARSFIGRALEYAARRSRRRPVMIGTGLSTETYWQPWSEACEVHGMEPPERWRLFSLPLTPPEAARHLTQALMQLPPDVKPDVLVVSDDHLVTEVTAGLLASDLPDAQLPLVIAHANFPKPPPALLPVTYLGFDAAQIVRACIDVLDAQRRGEQPSSRTLVPAVFASEHASSGGAHATLIDSATVSRRLLSVQEERLEILENPITPDRGEKE